MSVYKKIIFVILFLSANAMSSFSSPELPKSINIVSGIPLTISPQYLHSIKIKENENTGGWGDVMSNVIMALEFKKRYPQIQVRLIFTLNDDDKRKNVNKVRSFIPEVLKNENGDVFLNPDVKEAQYYKGVEIYFVSVPQQWAFADPNNLSLRQKNEAIKLTSHIPYADLGLQYSANNNPFSNLVVKSTEMQISFGEYMQASESYSHTIFNTKPMIVKLNAGPLGFGVYGFDSLNDGLHSEKNKKYVEEFLSTIIQKNSNQLDSNQRTSPLKTFHLNLSEINLAFAYAGDAELIEDYIQAVEKITEEKISKDSPDRKTVIVFKGSGSVQIKENCILVPIGKHPWELAHALISESTFSPLITGDGSFSSAIETMSPTKSYLYEGVPWKLETVINITRTVFKNDPEGYDLAQSAILPLTNELENEGITRPDRVNRIVSVLKAQSLHQSLFSYYSRHKNKLKIADNTLNVYQLKSIFKTIQKGIDKGLTFSEEYLSWLIEITKLVSVEKFVSTEKLTKELDDNYYGNSFQLLEKWFVLFTLWELDRAVNPDDVKTVIKETLTLLEQSETQKKDEVSIILFTMLDQINASEKSKQGLFQAMKNDKETYRSFDFLRKKYILQSAEGRQFFLPRENSCLSSYLQGTSL